MEHIIFMRKPLPLPYLKIQIILSFSNRGKTNRQEKAFSSYHYLFFEIIFISGIKFQNTF